ncbi:putative cell cycle control protein [Phaeomoniella chlamydospora]|uniref:Putative cell cycle control protein n=1 Tax=Phaeomoniella chlamydospora TaxID=158046 RepID=A0A0G2EQB3_PHACM|nr:putative cell cycle control protein [Phaeomoniella chlamydospora]
MEAPSALDIDYIQRPKRQASPPKFGSLGADYELKIHEKELNHHLRDLNNGKTVDDLPDNNDEEVSYTFGDSRSGWRMTKLRAVYRQATESKRLVEDVALERYGNLKDFDDAREEEIELERRETYGSDFVGKDKPSGDLYAQRKLDAGIRRPHHEQDSDELPSGEGEIMEAEQPQQTTQHLDLTALNRLKAQMMKAKLRRGPEAGRLEQEYNIALASFSNQKQADVVVLSAMDSRMLSSAPRNEVKAVTNRRGRERGQVEENEDMTIEDMVREERRTRGQTGGEGLKLAERIAKDAKFDNDLEYMDDNANKLAKRVQKSEINIRDSAINEFQKMNRILDSCALCHHEDTGTPPVAPLVSLATRTYLTLPTEPELNDGSACIVPIQHHTNLLECDDDEWEEIRNFMKSLTRMYHDQGRNVIFYENAAAPQRRKHAALEAVPLPYSLGETALAFFKEAILAADEEWTQHKKIIDTLKRAKAGDGKHAFRRTLVKEMPYFHVWFELDGGLGHVVEDSSRWPKGDLFAREIIGGMLDLGPEVIKKQGRWQRGHDRRVDSFQKQWRKFDWTRVLTEG